MKSSYQRNFEDPSQVKHRLESLRQIEDMDALILAAIDQMYSELRDFQHINSNTEDATVYGPQSTSEARESKHSRQARSARSHTTSKVSGKQTASARSRQTTRSCFETARSKDQRCEKNLIERVKLAMCDDKEEKRGLKRDEVEKDFDTQSAQIAVEKLIKTLENDFRQLKATKKIELAKNTAQQSQEQQAFLDYNRKVRQTKQHNLAQLNR